MNWRHKGIRTEDMKPGKSYIVDERIEYNPGEIPIIKTTIRKITKGKIKVGYRRGKKK